MGGILGAMVRFSIKGIDLFHYKGNFPLNTFIINITGSLILALLITVSLDVCKFDPDLKLGITTGFLGAYTTFSTICRETIGLMKEGNYLIAVFYILVTTIAGLAAAYTGVVIARSVIVRFVKSRKIEQGADQIEDEVE